MILLLAGTLAVSACGTLRGTGDMGVVIERATGSVQVIETTTNTSLSRITGLGDLSHASVVYSRDGRYAYVFGRDGGLSKIDILKAGISKRIIQSGNSIGGAISQDGHLIAVSNYTPGGVRIFDANTLEMLSDIPATYGKEGKRSKVVGLVDAPGQRFVFSLFDASEIWLVDVSNPAKPIITQYKNIGRQPYDALITPDGRYYLAGLFGEDGLAMLDLWHPDRGVKHILKDYGRGQQKLPVYKMPHLEGWASAGDYLYIPAVGRHEVLVINKNTWQQVKRIKVHGQPVFVMARPDGRQVWINFAHPLNDTIQVVNTETFAVVHEFKPGKAVLHMEFTPRGEQVWISVRDDNRVDVYDTQTFQRLTSMAMQKPSGIFLSARAHKIGL